MYNNKLLILLFSSLLFVGGCGAEQVPEDVAAATQTAFFSLDAFMGKEQVRLTEKGVIVTKTITLNGQQEEQTLKNLDLDKEFALFRQADINKAAWYDKYEVDSLFLGDQLQRLRYKATDEDLDTRWIEIAFLPTGEVSRIIVEKATASPLAKGSQKLVYEPQSGYRIFNQQENRTGSETAIQVEGKFKFE